VLSSQLAVLMAKDLRLHWRALAGAMADTLTLAAAAAYAIPQGPGPRVALVFNLNLMLAFLWSEWLITRERSKGTFRWLRTLPVDDRAVVGSKFAAAGLWSTAFWAVSSAMFARELLHPVGTWVTLLAGLWLFGGLAVAAKWRFSWRVGHIGPLLALVLPLLLTMTLAPDGSPRREALLALWNAPWGRRLAAGFLLSVYAIIILATTRWMRRADTLDLVD